jgi:ribosomal protein S18 acetylase RimI-like enzyme
MTIEIILAFSHPEEVRRLFTEYTTLLISGDPEFQQYLQIQNYDAEIAHLEQKYGPPAGRLYLAMADGAVAGCIALRKLDECRCEMKRLYIRPAFRGKGIARRLVEMLLADARQDGYEAMVLDTFPFLRQAVNLYRDLGFYEIPSYNDSPVDSTIYMRKDLCPA